MKTLLSLLLCSLLPALQAGPFFFGQQGAVGASSSSGFNAATYGTVALWTSPITQGSGTVSQINDYSGNARHFTQGTTAKQPAYSATALGGYPAFVSDGVDDEMTGATWTLPASGTLMIVGEKVSTSNSERLFEHGVNTQLAVSANSINGANGYRVQLGGTGGQETSANVGVFLITVNFNSSGFDWWINGTAQTSYSGAYTAASATSYLFRYGGGSFFGAWRMGDLVIWTSPLSTGGRTAAQTALGAAYGLSL